VTEIGTILGGRYRLVELLGQGGMATIYRARDNQLERDVAVKVLRPEYGADPDFIDRFRHEAQAAASLNHPGIVAVHDYGTDPAGPYIVMELIRPKARRRDPRRGVRMRPATSGSTAISWPPFATTGLPPSRPRTVPRRSR
jgi:serine/threonine protein kinase